MQELPVSKAPPTGRGCRAAQWGHTSLAGMWRSCMDWPPCVFLFLYQAGRGSSWAPLDAQNSQGLGSAQEVGPDL